MQYIDKLKQRQAGNQIVDKLLEDAWSVAAKAYKGADYEGLRKPKYADPFILLILLEQSDLCCYCMKKISNKNITLEHIIPHKIKLSDPILLHYFKNSELMNHVIHKANFDRTTKQISPEKYPHDIAYSNLVGSCGSDTHCNHYRGDKFIDVLFYDTQIAQKIQYDKAGRIDTEEYEDTCNELGISTNEKLRLIRKIWRILSTKVSDKEMLTDDRIDEEIYELIDEPDYTQLIEDFTGNPSYKDELRAYNWFFNYYKPKP